MVHTSGAGVAYYEGRGSQHPKKASKTKEESLGQNTCGLVVGTEKRKRETGCNNNKKGNGYGWKGRKEGRKVERKEGR